MNDRPLGYLGGDIMTFGSNLARQYEYDKFTEAGIPGSVYSPVQNKSINDKSNMTEEENNHLAEKITEADIDRLWNSDYVVMCPEQSAIGSMCELGCLYGWKYMVSKISELVDACTNAICDKYKIEKDKFMEDASANPSAFFEYWILFSQKFNEMMEHQDNKSIYAHYFDIRTNHLNEKDWRRSFSINQLLYGMILAATKDHTLHNSFDEIIPILKEKYAEE